MPCGTVVIADLDQIPGNNSEFGHVVAIHFNERIGEAVLDKVIVLVEELVLPEDYL